MIIIKLQNVNFRLSEPSEEQSVILSSETDSFSYSNEITISNLRTLPRSSAGSDCPEGRSTEEKIPEHKTNSTMFLSEIDSVGLNFWNRNERTSVGLQKTDHLWLLMLIDLLTLALTQGNQLWRGPSTNRISSSMIHLFTKRWNEIDT